MVAVEPWTWSPRRLPGPTPLGRAGLPGEWAREEPGVREEAKATPWLHLLEAWPTETVLWGHRGFFSLSCHQVPPGQGPGAGLGTGILNT